MLPQPLMDHEYFESGALRGRVLGPFMLGSSVATLVRSVHDGGRWIKPGKYATERRSEEVWRHLSGQKSASIAGRDIPFFEIDSLAKRFNPFHWKEANAVTPESAHLALDFAREIGLAIDGSWGIGGSRIFKNERPDSDLDIVLSASAEHWRSEIMRSFSLENRSKAALMGVRGKRFMAKYRGNHLDIGARNVFTATWRGRQIDIMSSCPDALIEASAVLSTQGDRPAVELMNVRATVVEDVHRSNFPILLSLRDLKSSDPTLDRTIRLLTFDPAAHYCRVGDVLGFDCLNGVEVDASTVVCAANELNWID